MMRSDIVYIFALFDEKKNQDYNKNELTYGKGNEKIGMHINQLIYFTKVVELGSITTAALKLHISQPALSKSIRDLEIELGQTLLSRTNRGVEPTLIGQKIYDESNEILEKIRGWYVDDSQAEPQGTVHVSCISSVSNIILNQVILPFSQKYPKIDVVLHNQYVSEIFTTIKNTPVNIALTSMPQLKEEQFIYQVEKFDLIINRLFKGTRCLLLGATHPWAKKDELELKDLKELSLATYSIMHDGLTTIYAPYFHNVYKMASKENIMELVVKNEAVFLPILELIQEDFFVKTQLVKIFSIPISDINHSVSVIIVSSNILSMEEQLFLSYLIKYFSVY